MAALLSVPMTARPKKLSNCAKTRRLSLARSLRRKHKCVDQIRWIRFGGSDSASARASRTRINGGGGSGGAWGGGGMSCWAYLIEHEQPQRAGRDEPAPRREPTELGGGQGRATENRYRKAAASCCISPGLSGFETFDFRKSPGPLK